MKTQNPLYPASRNHSSNNHSSNNHSSNNYSSDNSSDKDNTSSHHHMFRIGQGFDVHAFDIIETTTQIMLCGIPVPCDRTLLGTSDADVGLHALTDALLGALGMGDIGEHFPSDQSINENRSSEDFLHFALHAMENKGFQVGNVDITLISQIPKIQPYRTTMVHHLSDLLQTPNVSVKATTTDYLGFLGRSEGMAAMAIVLLVSCT